MEKPKIRFKGYQEDDLGYKYNKSEIKMCRNCIFRHKKWKRR